MSFGGSTAAANQSVKANRAIVRGRDHYFDRNVNLKTRKHVGELPRPTDAVREKNRRRLATEKARERKVWVITILITIALGAIYFRYALPTVY